MSLLHPTDRPDRARWASARAGRQRRLSTIWRLGYLAGMSALLFGLFSGWAYDDPFITFRYAHNLASGAGFVYNAGERVLSTTTALFALLLAGLETLFPAIHPHLPQAANLIGVVCLSCGGLLLWDLARSSRVPAAGWAGLLLYPTFPIAVTSLGSEMPLYVVLCLAAIAAYTSRRNTWAAAFASLAALARPDGILAAVVLAAHALFARWQTMQKTGEPRFWRLLTGWNRRPPVVFAAILLPWVLFAWVYFGSPIPVTLAAKQLQGSMPISQLFLPGLAAVFAGYMRRPYFALEALLAAAGLVFFVWRARQTSGAPETRAAALPRSNGLGLVGLWLVVYTMAYTLLGVSRYYWYYVPLGVGWAVAVGLGAAAASFAGQRFRPFAGSRAAGLAALLAVLAFAGQVYHLQSVRLSADRRIPAYRQAGEWLRANTPPQTTVGALEIGVIGYYAERPVIDFAGLIQPEVGRRLPGQSSYEEAARWAAKHYKPDYIVLRERLFPALESDYLARKCRPVHTIPADPDGYSWQITIYACRKPGV